MTVANKELIGIRGFFQGFSEMRGSVCVGGGGEGCLSCMLFDAPLFPADYPSLSLKPLLILEVNVGRLGLFLQFSQLHHRWGQGLHMTLV